MGCCSSSLVDQDLLTTSAERFNRSIIPLKAAYYESSKPFKRTGLMWTSDIAMTITELEQKRSTYWDSAPGYGGRIEIWQALQVAFSEPDVIMARSILEASNILLPTGNPCEGCFDEFGNDYNIPVYCVVSPTNLRFSDSTEDEFWFQKEKPDTAHTVQNRHSIYSNTQSNFQVPAPDSSLSPFSIIIRLSTEKDLKLIISSSHETVGSLRGRIFDAQESGIEPETHILRLIYLGRIMRDNMLIECKKGEEDAFSKEGSVRIESDSIIQALVATKPQN